MWQHPQIFFGNSVKLLSSLEEKINILNNFGIDNLIILNFNKELANKSSKEFIENILKDKFKISELMLGYNNNFGCDFNNKLNLDDYNIPILRLKKFSLKNEEKISSSEVRKLIEIGNIEKANELLNYNYIISGTVEHGFEIGRTLGFPTANIIIDEKEKLIPPYGVYISKTSFDNMDFLESLLYIGIRPSFNCNLLTIENHILNFNDDLYNKKISIKIFKKIRDDIKFTNKTMLINQLKNDINTTKLFFENY